MALTIILALWPDATVVHIDNLLDRYRESHPGAKIELLHCFDSEYTAKRYPIIGPDDTVLLHLFGDQAAFEACRLLRAHYSATGKILNVETVVIDRPPISTLSLSTVRPDRLLRSACTWTLSWASWIIDEPLYDNNTWIRQDFANSRLLPEHVTIRYAGTRMATVEYDSAIEEMLVGCTYIPTWLTWPPTHLARVRSLWV